MWLFYVKLANSTEMCLIDQLKHDCFFYEELLNSNQICLRAKLFFHIWNINKKIILSLACVNCGQRSLRESTKDSSVIMRLASSLRQHSLCSYSSNQVLISIETLTQHKHILTSTWFASSSIKLHSVIVILIEAVNMASSTAISYCRTVLVTWWRCSATTNENNSCQTYAE